MAEEKYKVMEVTTQSEPMIVTKEGDKEAILTIAQALARALNLLEEINKRTG